MVPRANVGESYLKLPLVELDKILENRVEHLVAVTRKRGLTIVELLVVVGILGVLISLSFPVLQAAKNASGYSSCAANLRQIGLAVTLYAGNSDDRLPPGVEKSIVEFGKPGTLTHPSPIYKYSNIETLLSPYLKDSKIYRCPADKGIQRTYYNQPNPGGSGMSAWEQFGSSYRYREVLGNAVCSKIPNQSQSIMILDLCGYWHPNSKPDPELTDEPWTPELLEYTFNMLFLDLHIKKGGVSELKNSYKVTENVVSGEAYNNGL